MAEASIPVDLFNPGQVFACLGFMEAAETLLGDAEAAFDWSATGGARFRLRATSAENPFENVLRFLRAAEVVTRAPHGSPNLAAWKRSWGPAPEELNAGEPYPSPDPDSPATLCVILRALGKEIRIDHWADAKTGRDNVKFWAGSGGYPGAALARDALQLIKSVGATASDPLAVQARQSSSFRLDWRRDYIPLDAGFSLNPHQGRIRSIGFPLVELLGVVGLENSRPERIEEFEYRYGIIGGGWLPPTLLRAALGCAPTPFAARTFRMHMSSPCKDARAITTVIEETAK